MILECAAAAHADVIISGDSHLLDLGQWKEIRILAPADFVKEIDGQPTDACD
jgi:predicted nucleic acid-binding protein